MNQRMTRDQLLRRGAVGLGALTVPGLLAACGGGGGSGNASGKVTRKARSLRLALKVNSLRNCNSLRNRTMPMFSSDARRGPNASAHSTQNTSA